MTWYAAHTITWVRFKSGEQDRYPVHENLLLICADTSDAAFAKAESLARDRYVGDDSGSYRYDDRPAERIFGGIRRLIECAGQDAQPTDGTEVTYQFLQVDTEKQLEALIANRDVVVKLHGEEESDAS
jgi:hypothetical protein